MLTMITGFGIELILKAAQGDVGSITKGLTTNSNGVLIMATPTHTTLKDRVQQWPLFTLAFGRFGASPESKRETPKLAGQTRRIPVLIRNILRLGGKTEEPTFHPRQFNTEPRHWELKGKLKPEVDENGMTKEMRDHWQLLRCNPPS